VNVKWFYLVLNSVALNKYKPIDNKFTPIFMLAEDLDYIVF